VRVAASEYPETDVTGHPQPTDTDACCDLSPQREVAIIPGSTRARYPELLRALGEAFAVRFVGSSGREIDRAHAAIVFPGGHRPERLPVPCLVLSGGEAPHQHGASFAVQMSWCPGLDRALQGQVLVEEDGREPAALALGRGCHPLALAAGKPIWSRSDSGGVECVTAAAVPSELDDGEFLRAHLAAGRFWSLLPIVHFLKRLRPPSMTGPRACFVIDDPNLRFSSYGYLSFPALATDARECGYHVAVATIPLDLTLPGWRAAPLFRKFRSELSLAVHGNDHVRQELERPRSAPRADSIVASAAARVASFEARAGIRIDRVVCPPHGACGDETLAALFRGGFLALAASRPFPWSGFSDHRNWRLGGWLPAQLAGGGLPVIPRYSLTRNLDDLALRALLGLPLIMYCHHTDLRNGLEPFRAAAARVASLGDVTWCSLASIARGNARWHDGGGVAVVTLYSRDARIPRPAAPLVRVELPRVFGDRGAIRLAVDGETHAVEPLRAGRFGVVVPNTAPSSHLRIRIVESGHPVTPARPERRPRVWPIARRAMTETRDRMLPIVRVPRKRPRP
jgi:hypothetical protein